MKLRGRTHMMPYRQRLAAVRRYVTTDLPAETIAEECGVKTRQFRKWVAELRSLAEQEDEEEPHSFRTLRIFVACEFSRVVLDTLIVDGRSARDHLAPPSPERWKERNRSYPGMASAMAIQWGGTSLEC